MKKSISKLTLQRETLKVLIGLELRRAVGGDPALVVADTGKEVCTSAAAVNDTGTEVCTAPAIKK
jgi:hypothetical protein